MGKRLLALLLLALLVSPVYAEDKEGGLVVTQSSTTAGWALPSGPNMFLGNNGPTPEWETLSGGSGNCSFSRTSQGNYQLNCPLFMTSGGGVYPNGNVPQIAGYSGVNSSEAETLSLDATLSRPSAGIYNISVVGLHFGPNPVALDTTAPTVGGIAYFYGSPIEMSSSGALTMNQPIFGGGAYAAPFSGSVTGNTTKVASSTGALVTNDCGKWDSSGNIVDAGGPCTLGGPGTWLPVNNPTYTGTMTGSTAGGGGNLTVNSGTFSGGVYAQVGLTVQGGQLYVQSPATMTGPDGGTWNSTGISTNKLALPTGNVLTFNGVLPGGTCGAGSFVSGINQNIIPTCGANLATLYAPLTNPAGGQNNYAPIASPTFTGTLTFPGGGTATATSFTVAAPFTASSTSSFTGTMTFPGGGTASATAFTVNQLLTTNNGIVIPNASSIAWGSSTTPWATLISGGADNMYLTAGTHWNGSAWVADSASADLINLSGSQTVFMDGFNLTVGGTFTPNTLAYLMYIGGGVLVLPNTSTSAILIGPNSSQPFGSIFSWSGAANDDLELAAGGHYNGSAWVADAVYSSSVDLGQGIIGFRLSAGLTVGASFNPSQVGIFDGNGFGVVHIGAMNASPGGAPGCNNCDQINSYSNDSFGIVQEYQWPVTLTFQHAFSGGGNCIITPSGAAAWIPYLGATNNTSTQIGCVAPNGAACGNNLWFNYMCFGLGV